jgi:predicted nucleotide-binding protein
MDNKPTVFIGSSGEGIKVAEAVKERFGDKAQVDVWNAGSVFTRNIAFLDSLLNASNLYEFAILVFTGDDTTVIRDETHTTMRDNVLFEFGLFLGRVGRRRAHALVEDKLRVPTDLVGIHFDKFNLDGERNPDSSFDETANRIVNDVLNYHANSAEFSHLPSTALAIGYFHNFISRICDQLDAYGSAD